MLVEMILGGSRYDLADKLVTMRSENDIGGATITRVCSIGKEYTIEKLHSERFDSDFREEIFI